MMQKLLTFVDMRKKLMDRDSLSPPGYCKYSLLESGMWFWCSCSQSVYHLSPFRTSDEAGPHSTPFRIFLAFFVELVMKTIPMDDHLALFMVNMLLI